MNSGGKAWVVRPLVNLSFDKQEIDCASRRGFDSKSPFEGKIIPRKHGVLLNIYMYNRVYLTALQWHFKSTYCYII